MSRGSRPPWKLALALALLVGVAGCVGSGGYGVGDSGTTPNDTATGTPGTPTTAATGGAPATTENPATTAGDGVGTFPAPGDLRRAHRAALANASSFTVSASFSGSGSEGGVGVNWTYRINSADGQLLRTKRFDAGGLVVTVETYRDGGDRYVRHLRGDAPKRVERGGDVAPLNASAAVEAGTLSVTLELVEAHEGDVERAGVERLDGDEVVRYRLTGTDATGEHRREFEAVLLVDRRGIVRRAVTTVRTLSDGEVVGAQRHRYAMSDVGETDVREPDWIDETLVRPAGDDGGST